MNLSTCLLLVKTKARKPTEKDQNRRRRSGKMEGEMKSFVKVWFTVIASLTYCYFIPTKIPKGMIRLLFILPIIIIFTLLPLILSTVHLVGIVAFLITWLANFKLLLFAFNLGPLSTYPSLSLLDFISIASLPIKTKQNPSLQSLQITKKGLKSPLNYAIKALLLALVIHLYNYRQHIHPNLLLALYCCNTYFAVEIVLAMLAAFARAALGVEMEPQFDEPYLSTSLQDFWGRRWNLMVTSILRPTVYEPVRCIATRILGRRWALLPAVLATFLVSGLMHELIYFYETRVEPTWEVTWFFVLHGICTAAEIVAKRASTGRCRLHRAVSSLLAVGFVMITGFWLFFPQIVRNGIDEKAIQEYGAIVDFFSATHSGF